MAASMNLDNISKLLFGWCGAMFDQLERIFNGQGAFMTLGERKEKKALRLDFSAFL
jgi:hypothetical protein